MAQQKSKPQIMVGDVRYTLTEISEDIATIEFLNRKYRDALAFAEKHIRLPFAVSAPKGFTED